jgi:DNA-directed RNA polymerase subunit RPC12/RpoP
MDDNRAKDRRKNHVPINKDKRKGPRRLTCDCGGKIEVKVEGKDSFVCARCGKKH